MFSNSHAEEKNVPFPERSIQHWRVSSETHTDHMHTHKIHKIQHIIFKPFTTYLSQHFNRYDFAPPTSSYSLVTCDSELKLLSFEKLEPQQKIIFPIIKVFPKDTSFFSLPHARRRPHRRATVAIEKI